MDSNYTTSQFLDSMNEITPASRIALVLPEYINAILLSLSIHGMYQGIEIKHPLYTILFTKLIIVLMTSLVDVIGYALLPFKNFVMLSNVMNIVSYLYHSSGWCLASILRYIYIFHESWIPTTVPNENVQSFLAVLFLLMTSTLIASPIVIMAKYYGESSK